MEQKLLAIHQNPQLLIQSGMAVRLSCLQRTRSGCFIYTYTHTHIHTHINMYTHTHTHVMCLAARLCPILCDPWTAVCQAPLSIKILQARILEWVAMPSSKGSFPTQGLNPGLLHFRQILYHLSHMYVQKRYRNTAIDISMSRMCMHVYDITTLVHFHSFY